MNSTNSPIKIIDFLDLSLSLKPQFDHLWHPTSLVTAPDDDDIMNYIGRPKYEVCAGNLTLVKGSTGCGHDKLYHYSFVTSTKSRKLDEVDIHDFKSHQKPVHVNLQNDLSLKDGDWLMLFYIDPQGILQHGSNGEWVEFCDLFGNESILKKDTWTRSLPNVVKASFAFNVFRSPREARASQAAWDILKNQEIVYTAMTTLHKKFVIEKRLPSTCSHMAPHSPLKMLPSKRSIHNPTNDCIFETPNSKSKIIDISTPNRKSNDPEIIKKHPAITPLIPSKHAHHTPTKLRTTETPNSKSNIIDITTPNLKPTKTEITKKPTDLIMNKHVCLIKSACHHLHPHFKPFFPVSLGGTVFVEGESAFLSSFLGVLRSYGIKRLVKTHSTLNLNSETMKLFPRKRVAFQCGSCDVSDRAKRHDVVGCCGFFMRLLLVSPPNELPCLQVKELRLPLTSKHLIISAKEYKAAESKVIVNEGLLSPTKTTFVKNMGKNRMKLQTVRNLLADTFEGLQCSTELLHRVMKKGRDDVWGSDENESMTVFYAEGLKLRSFDSKFGLAGKFTTKTCPSSGTLVAWLEQTPLEVANARIYGKDAIWVDTTHNATKYMFKTGSPTGVDWGGLNCPDGMFQVPEEEIEICTNCLIGLELDAPDATCNTDGGSAWPAMVQSLGQRHTEDTFHNDSNADKKMLG